MKYAIDRQFGFFRRFRPPFNRVAFAIAKVFLAPAKLALKGKELAVIKRKVISDDGKAFNIYIAKPKNAHDKLPAVLYLHGGGFVFKGAPYHFRLAKQYALQARCAVVFVDYRLAYAAPFGATFSDCVVAYNYLLSNADELGVDSDRVCFAGDSAGGYLCLALEEHCKTQRLPMPAKVMLIYPAADAETSSPSAQLYVDTPMWNARLNRKMWRLYRKGNNVFDPLRADLTGFAPTYLETAQFDCLHDEGVILADRLSKAGAECILNETAGTMHGFDICYRASLTRAAVAKRIEFLKSLNL